MYSVEKTRGFNYFKQYDYTLFIAVLILSIIGIVVLDSATSSMQQAGVLEMKKQIIALLLGIVLSIVISVIDYKDYKTLGIAMYLGSIFLLVLVLFKGTGGEQVGTKGWFSFGGISFQPSELAKITFVILISIFFERIKEGPKDRLKNILKLALYSGLPI